MRPESKLSCIVVDDEPLAAALIASYVERTPFLELISQADSAEEALNKLKEGPMPDLLFLDIRMPGLSGLELARLVPDTTQIIFTTAYADHALEGFRVHAFDYLLKPVSYDEFLQSAMRAFRSRRSAPVEATATAVSDHLLVKSEYRLLRLPLADIEFIEGLKDYVKIYLLGEAKPVLSLMSMKNLEESLAGGRFMRIHRSFIVNLDKVRVIERNCIIMRDRALPISDSYRKRFATAIGIEE